MTLQQTSTKSEQHQPPSSKENTMKIKLLTTLTAVALFALPIAQASANHAW
jgi:hypothetical protein